MEERFDLVVRGGIVIGTGPARVLDVGIRDGRFAALAEAGALAAAAADDVLDATGRHVLPGVIDGHVHFREPGLEYKGDWLTESRAAVMGGVTTVLDMPNTVPPTRDVAAARQKAVLAEAKSLVDFGFYGLVDGAVDIRRLDQLVESGLIVGLKVFLGPTTGGLEPPTESGLLAALSIARDAGMRVGFHAEDAQLLSQAAAMLGPSTDARSHLEARPASAEVAAIDHACRLLERSGGRGHIFHLSSAAGLAAIDRWRSRGLDLTSEVSAHHCLLGLADYDRLGAQLKVNPPVRGEPDASALLAALADGRIDAIASDHAPHAPGEKLGEDVAEVLPGLAGVETSLAMFLTAVAGGRLPLERLADATSAEPAKIWGLRGKGRIEVGADADLTVVDLGAEHTILGSMLHGKHNLTPFEGMGTVGAPVATVVGGHIAVYDGQLIAKAGSGEMVSRG